MVGAGTLIWLSVRPLIRLVFTVGAGFLITKADIFPPVAARGAGQIMLNICLPCLLFSKMVPAFTPDNIHSLGPLVLVAVLYEGIGIAMAWVVKKLFWVPHRFRYGILVAGGWGNVGDIPTSVVMSITAAAPFNGTQDQTLSIAYIAAFILVFMVTFFPCGGHRWIAMDFTGPDVEPEEVQEEVRKSRQFLLYGWTGWIWRRMTGKPTKTFEASEEPVSGQSSHEKTTGTRTPESEDTVNVNRQATVRTRKHVSFYDNNDEEGMVRSAPQGHAASTPCSPSPSVRFTSPEPTVTAGDAVWTHSLAPTNAATTTILPTSTPNSLKNGDDEKPSLSPTSPSPSADSPMSPPTKPKTWKNHPIISHLRTAFNSLISPPSLAILISFPIALIAPVKALFVSVPGVSMPSAPDGEPPLAFIMDTTTFIGAASVPLGLICLGSALARLKIPGLSREEWTRLPCGAIVALAVGKMIVSPVLGVLITFGLRNAGLVDREDKVLQFVCIFLSCLPTATTQVYVTQVYSGTGTADVLPAFLIPQYAIMLVSMTALTAYTLQALF